jgi:hypothetical protein
MVIVGSWFIRGIVIGVCWMVRIGTIDMNIIRPRVFTLTKLPNTRTEATRQAALNASLFRIRE